VPCESTAKEVSFEWLNHRISSTDPTVRTTLNVSITDYGSKRVKSLKGSLKRVLKKRVLKIKKKGSSRLFPSEPLTSFILWCQYGQGTLYFCFPKYPFIVPIIGHFFTNQV